jgi:lysophospholipid acyltransferase (LPLAT)-like uncharacterized protein
MPEPHPKTAGLSARDNRKGFGMQTYKLSNLERLSTILATPLIRLLGMTLHIRQEGRADLGFPKDKATPVLYTLWHETLLMGMWRHRGRGIRVLISQSRDGELVAGVAGSFGYVPVRGSSTRGGAEGARHMAMGLKKGFSGAITPDGPRGPRRQLHEGVLAIARLSDRMVLPVAFCAERQWRLKSWDQFIIPRPFSRAVFVYGEPIPVPRRGGDDVKCLKRIQNEMDRVTEEAEAYFTKR